MMTWLYLLMLVAASHAFNLRDKNDEEDIPAPRLMKFTLINDPVLAFRVDWKKIKIYEDTDPIEGYKLKVWERPETRKYRYESESENQMWNSAYSSSKVSSAFPTRKLRDIVVHGVENTSAQVNGVEPGVTYEVKVVAFTRNGDGPLSQPMKIQISSKKNNRDDNSHENDSHQNNSNQRDENNQNDQNNQSVGINQRNAIYQRDTSNQSDVYTVD